MIYTIGGIATALTCFMFLTKNMMLGFPSFIFWAVFAGFCYQRVVVVWDIYYILFFGSIGMAIFTAFAAYALRRRDLAGPDADKGKFIDEGTEEKVTPDVEKSTTAISRNDDFATPPPSSRAKGIRERAERRRTQGVISKKDYGEFR